MCDPDTEGEEKKKKGGIIHLGLNAEKLKNTWIKVVLFPLATTSISTKVLPSFTPCWAEQHRVWACSVERWGTRLSLAFSSRTVLPLLPTNLC